MWLLRPGQNRQLRAWWSVNSGPRRAAWSLCKRLARSEEGMMTRSCLKSKPSWAVISWRTDQYGRANSGTAALSLGHPLLVRDWRRICSGSVLAAVLMSWRVLSWKPENSGLLDSNSTRYTSWLWSCLWEVVGRGARDSVSNVKGRAFAIFNMERVSVESQHHAL